MQVSTAARKLHFLLPISQLPAGRIRKASTGEDGVLTKEYNIGRLIRTRQRVDARSHIDGLGGSITADSSCPYDGRKGNCKAPTPHCASSRDESTSEGKDDVQPLESPLIFNNR